MSPLVGMAILLVISVTLIAYSVIASKIAHRETMKRRMDDGAVARGRGEESSASEWFKKRAAPLLASPVKPKSASEQSNLRMRLANAGLRGESTPVTFLASKSILAVTLAVLALLGGLGGGHDAMKVFGMTAFAAGLGFMLPDLWLTLAKRARAEKITCGMPDCLDLMVVSVEAGLGLDAAIQRVGQEMVSVHPELCEEFILANREVQMGIARSEALENFALRTGVPEVKSLSAILIQAEKFGTSIATALRVHADTLRTNRRLRAEERAGKTSVKLTLPLILFIFPAIFVVLAGPAMLKLWETLGSVALAGG